MTISRTTSNDTSVIPLHHVTSHYILTVQVQATATEVSLRQSRSLTGDIIKVTTKVIKHQSVKGDRHCRGKEIFAEVNNCKLQLVET